MKAVGKSLTRVPASAAESFEDNNGPRSLSRVMRLFAVLSENADGVSLADLSVVLNSPKSSLLNLLRPLVGDGFLLHSKGLYSIGPALFRLSASVLAAWNFPRLIHPFLEELSSKTGETVLLGVLNPESDMMIYVDIVDSPHPIRYQIPVGTMRPLYASAAGRLLLAYADESYREEYLANCKFKLQTAKPINRATLKRELEKIRHDGISLAVDAYSKGLSAVAAPVFNADGVCVASMNIAGPTERIVAELDFLRATLLVETAKASGVVPKRMR